MNKRLPINVDNYKCDGCGGVIEKGVLNARIEIGEPITKWHVFCDLCYKKWYLDDLKRKIGDDPQVLRDVANAAGYIVKKVDRLGG